MKVNTRRFAADFASEWQEKRNAGMSLAEITKTAFKNQNTSTQWAESTIRANTYPPIRHSRSEDTSNEYQAINATDTSLLLAENLQASAVIIQINEIQPTELLHITTPNTAWIAELDRQSWTSQGCLDTWSELQQVLVRTQTTQRTLCEKFTQLPDLTEGQYLCNGGGVVNLRDIPATKIVETQPTNDYYTSEALKCSDSVKALEVASEARKMAWSYSRLLEIGIKLHDEETNTHLVKREDRGHLWSPSIALYNKAHAYQNTGSIIGRGVALPEKINTIDEFLNVIELAHHTKLAIQERVTRRALLGEQLNPNNTGAELYDSFGFHIGSVRSGSYLTKWNHKGILAAIAKDRTPEEAISLFNQVSSGGYNISRVKKNSKAAQFIITQPAQRLAKYRLASK